MASSTDDTHTRAYPALQYLALAALGIYSAYRIIIKARDTYRSRQKWTDIPGHPRHWLFGNLKSIGEKCNPAANRHPDYGFEEMWIELGRPGAFMIDLAPVDFRNFLIVADPHVAEAIAQPSSEYKYSPPKSDTMWPLKPLFGTESLITAEGEEWRDLRKRFNKGFAPAYLHNLCPLITSKTKIFLKRIQDAARTGEVVALKHFSMDLTNDIITELTIETDFEAQSIPEGQGPKATFGFLTAAHTLSSLADNAGQGFDPLGYVNFMRKGKEWLYETLFNREIYKILSHKLQEEQSRPKKKDSSARSIVGLALADVDHTEALLRNTVSQVKSFLFAGQDTTATTIQWICYALSKADFDPRYREIVDKVEAEHNSVFGSGVFSALDVLSRPGKSEELLEMRLPYTTAFIKETLRLHPPAGTARFIPDASETSPTFYVDIDGKSTRIDGLRIYNCQWIIHRNPLVWGEDAHVFNPDRWLDKEYMSKIPPGAWRPFERGPRNCIGQPLALLEAKVVMAAVTRGIRFEKVGNTGRNGEKEVWGIKQVTTVPSDGMTMRFHSRQRLNG